MKFRYKNQESEYVFCVVLTIKCSQSSCYRIAQVMPYKKHTHTHTKTYSVACYTYICAECIQK